MNAPLRIPKVAIIFRPGDGDFYMFMSRLHAQDIIAYVQAIIVQDVHAHQTVYVQAIIAQDKLQRRAGAEGLERAVKIPLRIDESCSSFLGIMLTRYV